MEAVLSFSNLVL